MATVGDITISVQELKELLRRAWSDGWQEAAVKACQAINEGKSFGADASTGAKGESDVGRLLLGVLIGTSEAKDGKG